MKDSETSNSEDSVHQFLVKLADQAERKRQGLQAFHSVLQRGDVVADLAQVLRTAVGNRAGFRGQQFAQGCLRAFDSTGVNGFM